MYAVTISHNRAVLQPSVDQKDCIFSIFLDIKYDKIAGVTSWMIPVVVGRGSDGYQLECPTWCHGLQGEQVPTRMLPTKEMMQAKQISILFCRFRLQ